MGEINRKRLKELLKIPDNNFCADCADPEPNYASITIGIFLCASCVQIHRKLGTHISRTVSLTHDNWDSANVSFMEDTGNAYAKSLYEKFCPPYYRKPLSFDEEVLKEQWIRAKYERKEFMNSTDTIYTKGYMEGFLYKKGKENNKFNKRRFILSQVDCTLKYFVKDKLPKAIIKVEELNATFCSKKLGKPYSLQLTYPKDGKMRSIFIYTDDGKEIVDWYMAIRAVQYNNFKILYSCPIIEILPLLSQDFIKEGYLHKTGSKVGDVYKKRWFTLHRRVLLYFVEPINPYAKGEIYLQEKQDGYSVVIGVPVGLKEHRYGFTLVTPERKYLLGADSEKERDDWMQILNAVINTPQSIYDNLFMNYRNQMKNSYTYRKMRNSNTSNSLSTRSNLTSTNSMTSLNITDRSSNSSFTSTNSSAIKKGKSFFSLGRD